MFVCMKITPLYFFRYVVLAIHILSIILVQDFKALSTINITELLDLNGHIKMNPLSGPEGSTHINNSLLEPVLFEKLHNIKLSHSVLSVTTFFQLKSTKVALEILLQYMHDFKESLTILFSKLVTKNELDHKSYDVRQCVLTYSTLPILCTD